MFILYLEYGPRGCTVELFVEYYWALFHLMRFSLLVTALEITVFGCYLAVYSRLMLCATDDDDDGDDDDDDDVFRWGAYMTCGRLHSDLFTCWHMCSELLTIILVNICVLPLVLSRILFTYTFRLLFVL